MGQDVQRATRVEGGRSPSALRKLVRFLNLKPLMLKGETSEPLIIQHLTVLIALPTLQRIDIEFTVRMAPPVEDPSSDPQVIRVRGSGPFWSVADLLARFLVSFLEIVSVSMPKL